MGFALVLCRRDMVCIHFHGAGAIRERPPDINRLRCEVTKRSSRLLRKNITHTKKNEKESDINVETNSRER